MIDISESLREHNARFKLEDFSHVASGKNALY